MKGKKIKIGFDLDGVLIDHKKNRKMMARRLGYSGFSEKTPVSEYKKKLKKEDYRKIQFFLYGRATLKAPPIKNSRKVLSILNRNFEIFIITQREPANKKVSIAWLKKYFPFLPARRFFFVVNEKGKAEIAKRLGIILFMDDKISVLEYFPSEIRRVLFDEFSGRKNSDFENIKVIHSHKELLGLEIFDKIG